jgi:hypothetical protein
LQRDCNVIAHRLQNDCSNSIAKRLQTNHKATAERLRIDYHIIAQQMADGNS